jgi:4-amino-4-deoxy-L-arabinose transferase-like glycosyltransferase
VNTEAPHPRPRLPRRATWIAIILCAWLLALFGVLSYRAAMTKSPTMDEPLHATGAYAHVFLHDYRVNPEDPPLWNFWAMLPHRASSLTLRTDSPLWAAILSDTAPQMSFSIITLFQQQGNDGVRFINHSRAMMVLLGVALGAVIAVWAWQLAGPVAAVSATLLYTFDPNFLGHAPLVKNDVTITLLMTAMAWCLWRAGRRATVLNLLAAALVLGAALTTKFSGILLVPMFAIVLVIRAAMPSEWRVMRWTLATRQARFVASGAIIVVSAILSVAMIWAVYGFRFEPTSQPGSRLPTQRMVEATIKNQLFIRNGHQWPSDEQVKSARPGPFVRAILFVEQHKLLPQAWLYGLLFTYQSALVRESFLIGNYSMTGWWYYFPLAMLFKTPVGTILAGIGALVVMRFVRPRDMWMRVALGVPLVIYALAAMSGNLNLGVRHVLPLYPLMYVGAAVLFARARSARPRAAGTIGAVIAMVLAVESGVSFPNYIAFFNTAVGGSRGGFALLSDSNLDWGQDLPLLAEWQREHPDSTLYLGYYGSTDPAAYGIRYLNMPGGFYLNRELHVPQPPGVMAISASRLQGVYLDPVLRDYYANIRDHQQPIAILGGSIYLYAVQPASR